MLEPARSHGTRSHIGMLLRRPGRHGLPLRLLMMGLLLLMSACPDDEDPEDTTSPPAGTAPSLTGQPADLAVTEGESARFSLSATGDPAPTYQWERSTSSQTVWTPIQGAEAASYTLSAVTTSDDGARFRAIVQNSVGTVTSEPASLTVVPRPLPPTLSAPETALEGDTLLEASVVSPQDGMRFVWTLDNGLWASGEDSEEGETVTFMADAPGTLTLTCVAINTLDVASAPSTATIEVGSASLTVTVDPEEATLEPRQARTFTATVSGSSDQAVTWSLQEGDEAGLLEITGALTVRYTAPTLPGLYHLIVTSHADSAVSATVPITVTPGAGLRISPDVGLVAPESTLQFSAYLDGVPVDEVSWSVLGSGDIGSISSSGLYTAGAQIGTYTVQAEDSGGHTAEAMVTVSDTLTVTIRPESLEEPLMDGDTLWLEASVNPSGVESAVVWSVVEPDGGEVVPYSWSSVYIPPSVNEATTYHIKATSVADPSVYALLEVPVEPYPETGSFTATKGKPSSCRNQHSALMLDDGRVLVVGGIATGVDPIPFAELYSPSSGQFSVLVDAAPDVMPIQPVLVRLDSTRVLIVGGQIDWNKSTAKGWVLNTSSGALQPVEDMASPRVGFQALPVVGGTHDGQFLVMGGRDGSFYYDFDYDGDNDDFDGDSDIGTLATTEYFDPVSLTFSPGPSMKVARAWYAATLLDDGRILVVGGQTGEEETGRSDLASAELFDPTTGAFQFAAGSLSSARILHSATLLEDGRVLVAGGTNVSDEGSAELFDPDDERFTPVEGGMEFPRFRHSAVRMDDGSVLIVGGETGAPTQYVGMAEVYEPDAGFTMQSTLQRTRTDHTATLLSNGRVLVVGDMFGVYEPLAELGP